MTKEGENLSIDQATLNIVLPIVRETYTDNLDKKVLFLLVFGEEKREEHARNSLEGHLLTALEMCHENDGACTMSEVSSKINELSNAVPREGYFASMISYFTNNSWDELIPSQEENIQKVA